MANNDREIEIKIPLDKNTFSRAKEKLKGIAKFVKSLKQVDEYFTPMHRNFVEPKFPFEWLSIRRRGNKVFLNYKHYYPENVEIATHCDEFETEIKDPEQLEKIFSVLDFKKLVTVEKEREIYIYNDEFEIALDRVKDLGFFIEIEAIKDFGSIEKTREKLFEIANFLGIDISKTDKRGYPYLLMKKKGFVKQ
jgi:adenylate cyclase class 2